MEDDNSRTCSEAQYKGSDQSSRPTDYLLPVRMERKGLQNCLTAVPNEVNILRFYDADVYMVVRRCGGYYECSLSDDPHWTPSRTWVASIA